MEIIVWHFNSSIACFWQIFSLLSLIWPNHLIYFDLIALLIWLICFDKIKLLLFIPFIQLLRSWFWHSSSSFWKYSSPDHVYFELPYQKMLSACWDNIWLPKLYTSYLDEGQTFLVIPVKTVLFLIVGEQIELHLFEDLKVKAMNRVHVLVHLLSWLVFDRLFFFLLDNVFSIEVVFHFRLHKSINSIEVILYINSSDIKTIK